MVDPKHTGAAPMLGNACAFSDETLPEPLPAEPLGLFMQWLELATSRKSQPNPNAMTLATVGVDGQPSARVVLARRVDVGRGYVVFYSNYHSRKGEEIAGGGKVALCFHWDQLDRQVRMEGVATMSPPTESDAYFNARPPLSRLAAWASDQSRPVASRQELLDQNHRVEARFGLGAPGVDVASVQVPRPPHWGGYRVWLKRVELWRGHTNRLHDRAVWERSLTPAAVDRAPGFVGGAWASTRLQP